MSPAGYIYAKLCHVYLFRILIILGPKSNDAVAKPSKQRSGILKQEVLLLDDTKHVAFASLSED